jgi:hypothetical protein
MPVHTVAQHHNRLVENQIVMRTFKLSTTRTSTSICIRKTTKKLNWLSGHTCGLSWLILTNKPSKPFKHGLETLLSQVMPSLPSTFFGSFPDDRLS